MWGSWEDNVAGQESPPGEIDELGSERCKSYQVFLCWKAKLCVRLDAGMRRELQKTSGWLQCREGDEGSRNME